MSSLKDEIQNKSGSNIFYFLCLFIVFTVCLYYLFPILDSIYYNDDKYNNAVVGFIMTGAYTSIWDMTKQIILRWIDGGRFYPLGFLSYSLYSLLPTLFSYKLYLFIITVIDLLLFARLLYKITDNKYFALSFLAFFPILCTISFTYNSYICQHGLVQLCLFFFLISSLFFISFLSDNKKYKAISASFFSCIPLMIYEVSYLFIFIYPLIIFSRCHNIKNCLKNFMYFLIPFLCILGITFYFRIHSGSPYQGTTVSLSWKMILPLVNLSLSCFPGITYFKYCHHFIDYLPSPIPAIFISFVITMILYFLPKKEINNFILLIAILFILFIFPILLLSITVHYQKGIHFGSNHLVTFISNFAFCGIIALCFYRVSKERVKKICSFCFFCLLSFNIIFVQCSVIQSRKADIVYESSRRAFEAGLLKNVDSISVPGEWFKIFPDKMHAEAFIAKWSGKVIPIFVYKDSTPKTDNVLSFQKEKEVMHVILTKGETYSDIIYDPIQNNIRNKESNSILEQIQ